MGVRSHGSSLACVLTRSSMAGVRGDTHPLTLWDQGSFRRQWKVAQAEVMGQTLGNLNEGGIPHEAFIYPQEDQTGIIYVSHCDKTRTQTFPRSSWFQRWFSPSWECMRKFMMTGEWGGSPHIVEGQEVRPWDKNQQLI